MLKKAAECKKQQTEEESRRRNITRRKTDGEDTKKKKSRIVFSVELPTVSGQGKCHAQFYYLHTGTNDPAVENSSVQLYQNVSFEIYRN